MPLWGATKNENGLFQQVLKGGLRCRVEAYATTWQPLSWANNKAMRDQRARVALARVAQPGWANPR